MSDMTHYDPAKLPLSEENGPLHPGGSIQPTAPRKIIVAMDAFKGCLTAQQACQAVVQGIQDALPQTPTVTLPVSDGGEGLLEACTLTQRRYLQAENPRQETISTCYGIDEDNRIIIETARVIGLPLLDETQRNPWLTTSYGIGEVIADALERGYRDFAIGLGGSATTDAGLGMLQALGCRLYDKQGREIDEYGCGRLLARVAYIDTSCIHPLLGQARFTIICDVTNPLYGKQGAAYVFAPQKGADPKMVEDLDQGLQHIASVMEHDAGRQVASLPGAGAAGGLGAAFMAFMQAELVSGIGYVLNRLHFRRQLEGADFVITGEGRSDRQTLMGKVPQGILLLAKERGIPVFLLSGAVTDIGALNEGGFCGVFSITQGPDTLAHALQADTAIEHLRLTARQLCRTYAASCRMLNGQTAPHTRTFQTGRRTL